MATDPALALQAALVLAIRELGTPVGQRVYDAPPRSNPFPRVTIGPSQSVPNDADGYAGTETFVQIDAWSRDVGYPEVKAIADAIRDRLHNGAFDLDGHVVDLMTVESIDYSRDPDGLTSRARIALRILTQPSTPDS